MLSRYWKPIGSILILLVTISVCIYFFKSHPQIGDQLKHTSVRTLLTVLFLYLLFMAALGLITNSTVAICRGAIPMGETFLLTAYSSIINFFGPLQSGPAFRALYLKKKYNVSVKNYALASILYYLLYAMFSGLLLISAFIGWFFTAVLAIVGLVVFYYLPRLPIKKFQQLKTLDLKGVPLLTVATFLQVWVLVLIFYTELHSVNPAVTLSQAAIYTGAANFALFVSITPGAIGFREAFVLFTQHLHHIDNATIVAASLIDRGVYVAMLLLLVVLIFGSQGGRKLRSLKSTSK
ncbi:MAG: hypothetical protein JWN38_224 [Candidatus Saccharibacteria bacterium]|nr:hypothetical protein [Candidatus Saccharibacteria bacterium]